ncbi:hypothetical protein HS961_15125 [Comamonas piscis]|uniref:Uncharacterized protein n=1 Tax=Comamonas piscis TaxID=1562974 RepID=A0A7G5EJ86_9BURK|nr:hypothetical protein [Comamonas piscis]QMV74061.1 hypothetical protein HS961_15125 [Comamonas piscis]WSO32495.1 hypothetical protein VUJ63_15165 [Comamonas piscis]
MLFFHARSTALLQRVIRAAVASDTPSALSAFLASQGSKPFAQALSGLAGPVIADALSMLSAAERARVLPHVSRVARKRLQGLDRSARLAVDRPSGRSRALCWLFGHRADMPASRVRCERPPLAPALRTAKRSA